PPLSQAPEVLAEGQGLPLVGRADPDAIDPLGSRAQTLEQDLERRLAVVDHERHLARPHLHDHLGAQNRPVAPAESGVEEARVVRANARKTPQSWVVSALLSSTRG